MDSKLKCTFIDVPPEDVPSEEPELQVCGCGCVPVCMCMSVGVWVWVGWWLHACVRA